MTKERFWSLIREETYHRIYTQQETRPQQTLFPSLIKKLVLLNGDELAFWFQIYGEYYNIANISLLRLTGCLIYGKLSINDFIEFRSWLIAQGENTYHCTLENPEYLAGVLLSYEDTFPSSFKQFSYIVEDAFNRNQNSFTLYYNSLYQLAQQYPLPQETFCEIHDTIRLSPEADIRWEHLSKRKRQQVLPILSAAIKKYC